MANTRPQIITAFNTTMHKEVLRGDAMLVRPDGSVLQVREGVAGFVKAALARAREDVMQMVQDPGLARYFTETERRAGRLPREYMDALMEQPVAHTVCVDTPGGDGSVFKVVSHALAHSHAKGGSSAVFAGRKLESTGMLIGANAHELHALRGTNILMHAPALDLESLGLTEADLTPESLRDMRAEQARNAASMHAFVGSKVTGMMTRFRAKRKMKKARNDASNPRGEVEFKASELPGFVTKTYPDPAALAAAFTAHTGLETKAGIERPSDSFFTLLDLRTRIAKRLQETLGGGDVFSEAGGAVQATLPMDMRHREADAVRIVQEEVAAMQDRLGH